MRRRIVLLFPALGAMGFLVPRVATAQGEPPVRIRGTIAALDGASLTIIARDGQTVTVQLTEPLIVMTVKKADLSAIGPNAYIGTTTRTGVDGMRRTVDPACACAVAVATVRGRNVRNNAR